MSHSIKKPHIALRVKHKSVRLKFALKLPMMADHTYLIVVFSRRLKYIYYYYNYYYYKIQCGLESETITPVKITRVSKQYVPS